MSDNGHNVVLDKDDSFEAALIGMVLTARKKRKDYAQDANPFSNFEGTAAKLAIPGFGRKEAALFNVLQKIERLSALRANGRMDDPQNEAVIDTYLDLAVYSTLLLAMAHDEWREAEAEK